MSALAEGRAGPPGPPGEGSAAGPAVAPYLEPSQRRQLAWITLAAIALFVALRLLPTGTNLSHMDFRVDPKGGAALEFCDPSNPQFIPVVAVRSPVVMKVRTESSAMAGQSVRGVVTLETAGGKPIAAVDLEYVHTRKLHLLIVDPTLADYQHVHPEPSRDGGEWAFRFTPRRSGTYRVFADFMPAATGRGLYASADLEVGGSRPPGAVETAPGGRRPPEAVERDGYRYELVSSATPVRAGEPVEWRFSVGRTDGAPVALQPVMDALAHLVAIDEARSGFAHLHPVATDVLPNAANPGTTTLLFKLTIPKPGRYVIWAQLNLGEDDVFVPFEIEVR